MQIWALSKDKIHEIVTICPIKALLHGLWDTDEKKEFEDVTLKLMNSFLKMKTSRRNVNIICEKLQFLIIINYQVIISSRLGAISLIQNNEI